MSEKKNRILFFSNLISLSPISSKNKFIDTFDFDVIEYKNMKYLFEVFENQMNFFK